MSLPKSFGSFQARVVLEAIWSSVWLQDRGKYRHVKGWQEAWGLGWWQLGLSEPWGTAEPPNATDQQAFEHPGIKQEPSSGGEWDTGPRCQSEGPCEDASLCKVWQRERVQTAYIALSAMPFSYCAAQQRAPLGRHSRPCPSWQFSFGSCIPLECFTFDPQPYLL